MTTIYIEEITDDDPGPPATHNGEEVEQLAPVTVPVHTLTGADVAAAKKAAATPAAEATSLAEAAKKRGNAAFAAKNSVEAIAAYTEAIRLDGGNGLLWGNRSAAHLQAQQPEAALADAEKMVDLLPSLAKAHFRLGNAHDGCGERAAAATAYLEALRLEPANDALAGAVQRSSDALKKDPEHAALCAACAAALDARKGGGEAAAKATRHTIAWSVAAAAGGEAPAKRGGATLTALGGRLILAGGADRNGVVHDDVWEYAPESGWRRLAPEGGELFSARSGHAAAAVGAAALVVFGGQHPPSDKLYGDALRLAADGAEARWEAVEATGPAPGARNGHSLSWCADAGGGVGGSLWMFGGADGEGHLSELWRLRSGGGADGAAGWEWSKPACTGEAPAAREMHAAAALAARGALVVHGGNGGAGPLDTLHLLDLATLVWAAPVTTPCARLAHAAALLAPAEAAPRLVFFGGFSGGALNNDVWALADGAAAVEKVKGKGDAPQRRFAACAAALGATLYVFGGSSQAEELADGLHAGAVE